MRSKRLVFPVTVLLILLLTGCGSVEAAAEIPEKGFPQVNHNNNQIIRHDSYFFDQAFFYEQDGFYNMGVYRCLNGTYTKLFEASDFEDCGGLNGYYISGSDLYFVMCGEGSDYLYRYDLRTDTYALVCRVETGSDWGVVDQFFIYKTENIASALCVLDMETGESVPICEDALQFGLIGEEVRYVVQTDAYEVYSYDLTSGANTKLGAFSCGVFPRYVTINFTPDEVLIFSGEFGDGGTFVAYSISQNTVTDYAMPREIHEMVAGEDAVFLLVYNNEKNSSEAVPSKENGVYRVNLKDGSCEMITGDIDNHTAIYVYSDDCIYLVQGGYSIPGFYSRVAYRLDIAEGTKETVGKLRIVW